MVVAQNPDVVHEAVHPSDLVTGDGGDLVPKEGATVWRFRSLSMPQRVALADAAFEGEVPEEGRTRLRTNTGTVRVTRARQGLLRPQQAGEFKVAWEDQPSPADPSRREATMDYVGRIPDEVIAWLDEQIQGATQLSEVATGKSERPSSQPTGEAQTPPLAESADG